MRGSCRTLLLFCVVLFSAGFLLVLAAPASKSQNTEEKGLKDLAALHPIDVHVHVFKNDPAFQKMLEDLNLKVMNILVMDDTLSYRKELQPQVDEAISLMHSSRGHIAFCTTFDPYK